ncbi:unnamed protein product [Amoebophrya sp. A120]|nr:unnamed protein product [Amoebophrya sp. A120]|eukprot:GSA120T00018910001.1
MRSAGGSKQTAAAVSTTSTVTVSVRARPFLPRDEGQRNVVRILPAKEDEKDSNPTIVLDVLTPQLVGDPVLRPQLFAFDHCFDGQSPQQLVYDTIGQRIVDSAVNGYNACVFAYGQTGSGKSYSIIGPETDEGLIPRVSRELFAKADVEDFRVTVSFLEIYNEQLRDLLNPAPRKKPLYVHQHPKLGVYVPHLTEAPVTDHAEAMSRLDFGAKIRATAQTCMNSQSSRSHSLFIVRMTRTAEKVIYSSSINLIDLAGSERVKKAGHHRGGRMLESSAINSSLSVLGLVISKLAGEAIKKGQHVPFRQSKLTYLLQDALSGNSKTWMIANISPAQTETEETLSTLRFAQSVKKVRLTASVNQQDETEADMMLQTFRTEIEDLRQELHSNHNPSSPKAGRLRRELEAIESATAMVSSKYDRRGWDDARRREKEQELMRQEVLANLKVGHIKGLACDHPYILNISDDVAVTGRLLYTIDQPITHVGSAANNQIRLLGLGIGGVMCTIKRDDGANKQEIKLHLQKKEKGGRLMINGREVADGTVTELQHGDRLVIGRAFSFRLIMPGMPTTEESIAETSSVEDPELRKLQDDVDESNELIRELLGETGPQLSVGVLSNCSPPATSSHANGDSAGSGGATQQGQEPGQSPGFSSQSQLSNSPVHVVQQRDESGSLVAVWLQSAFYCRLDIMRDLYQQHLENLRSATEDGATNPTSTTEGEAWTEGGGGGKEDTLQATQVWEPGSTNIM